MKKFNLAEWALRHKSIIYYFIAMFFTLGVFSFLNLGRMEDPNHHSNDGSSRFLARCFAGANVVTGDG